MTRSHLAVASVLPVLFVLIYPASIGSADKSEVIVAVQEDGVLQKVNLASWGGGKGELDDKVERFDRQTIRVDTRGFHEGVRFVLQLPLRTARRLNRLAAARGLADQTHAFVQQAFVHIELGRDALDRFKLDLTLETFDSGLAQPFAQFVTVEPQQARGLDDGDAFAPSSPLSSPLSSPSRLPMS